MTTEQKLQIQLSETRGKLRDFAGRDDLSDDERKESDRLVGALDDLEVRHRAAVAAGGVDPPEVEVRGVEPVDVEARERRELRSKAKFGDFFAAALRGHRVGGASGEYSDAFDAGGGIPLDLWEPETDLEVRAVSPAPSTVGVNLAAVQPYVYSRSVAPMLGIDMPNVPSGTYAVPVISTALTAGARAKNADQVATAAALTVHSMTPHSISSALELQIEDVAAVGTDTFESALRENLMMALSDSIDRQILTGDGTGANLSGIFQALTNPTAATAEVTFDSAVESAANLVDGIWAEDLMQVRQLVGVDTFRKFASTFQPAKAVSVGTGGSGANRDIGAATDGDRTICDWLKMNTGGVKTNEKMPAASSNVQAGLAFRMGRPGMRTAVCPVWGHVSITDYYSGAPRGQTRFVMHHLCGDVRIIQAGAYAETSYHLGS